MATALGLHEFGYSLVGRPEREGDPWLCLKVGRIFAEGLAEARAIAAGRIDEQCLAKVPAERIEVNVEQI